MTAIYTYKIYLVKLLKLINIKTITHYETHQLIPLERTQNINERIHPTRTHVYNSCTYWNNYNYQKQKRMVALFPTRHLNISISRWPQKRITFAIVKTHFFFCMLPTVNRNLFRFQAYEFAKRAWKAENIIDSDYSTKEVLAMFLPVWKWKYYLLNDCFNNCINTE